MKLAFLYAGQGSQKPGMGKDFYDGCRQIRHHFDQTPLGLDLRALCFDSPAEELAKTRHTQPCMGAFGAAVTQLLAEAGICPDYAAGLSLGEYGALHAAGVFDAPAYIELLAYRGKFMAEATQDIKSAMVAVFSLDEQDVDRALAQVGDGVWCCNFNCPGQIVIGGEESAVRRASEICREMGAKRCIPLSVSGPFHTPFMAPAALRLKEQLTKTPVNEMQIPVVFNTSGDFLAAGYTVDDMLTRQVRSPVRFEACVRTLIRSGVDTIIEIGPGKVLSGFVKKIAPEVTTYAIEDVGGLQKTIEALKGEPI